MTRTWLPTLLAGLARRRSRTARTRPGCKPAVRSLRLEGLDWADAEARLGLEPQERLTPETLYDAQWALLLLDRATERLRQEHEGAGKAATFAALRCESSMEVAIISFILSAQETRFSASARSFKSGARRCALR